MSQPYSEAIDVRLSVTYTPCDTYPRGETGNIIMFAQFEERGLLYESHNDAESGDKSDDDSIMPPLLSKEDIDALDCGNESDDEPMSAEMLEYIRDGSQSHQNVNRIEARYKINDCIKQKQSEWKVVLKAT